MEMNNRRPTRWKAAGKFGGTFVVCAALLVGAGGCTDEAATIVMPENPKPLPNPQQRLSVGEEAPAASSEIELSE
jgi:hypothetical protein